MKLKFALLCSAACAVSFGSVAYAQDQAQPSGDTTTVSGVIITASKRSENVQDVTAAVSAFTSEDRDNIGIQSVQDLTNFTPGLDYRTSTDRLAIRGIGRNTNNLTADPGVATYVDGVYNAQTFNAAGDPLFVERIEVLRGPEGTLYGRNAIGGAINAISKRPDDFFNGEARVRMANYDRQEFAGTVTGPIANGVNFRINAALVNQEQGYFKNVVHSLHSEGGNTFQWYIEGQLSAKFSDNLEGWVKISDRYWDTATRSSTPTGPLDVAYAPTGTSGPGPNYAYCGLSIPGNVGCTAGAPINVVFLPGAIGDNPGNTDIRTFQSNQYGHTEDKDNYAITGELIYHLPSADLKYVGGYQHYYLNIDSGFWPSGVYSLDLPCTAPCTPVHVGGEVPFFWIEDKSFWSHELNLTSTGSGPLQWIAGLYYYGESYNQPVNYSVPDDAFLSEITLPWGNIEGPTRSIDYYNTVAKGRSYAAFGQVDWQFTPTLKATFGLRFTEDHKEGTEMTRQLYAYVASPYTVVYNLTPTSTPQTTLDGGQVGQVYFPDATGIGYRDYHDTWAATTGTAGIEWRPNMNNMLYAKYSRGYKSGGFNTGFLAGTPETQPEYVNAYEVGYKATFSNTLRIDAAIYRYDYLNDQIPISVQVLNSPAQTQFFNIPKVLNQGFELEALWAPTERFTATLAYSYAKATINSTEVNGTITCFQDGANQHPSAAHNPWDVNLDGCTAGSGYQNVTGNTLPQTPKNKIGLNVQYRFDFLGGDLVTSANYIWRDKTYSSIFNTPYNQAPSYDQVDLRALWTDPSGKYTVIGYVKNVFDTLGYDGVGGRLLTHSYDDPDNPVLGSTVSLTPPRTYGVELQHRF